MTIQKSLDVQKTGKVEELTLLDFKTYYKVTVIKAV
jgi:hypothetical protein